MKKNLIVARIIVMVIGMMVGALLLVLGLLPTSMLEKIIWIALIVYGVIVIIGNVPGLISGIANIHKAAGIFDLIASALGIALGIALIFSQNKVLAILLAVYLIIFPIIRIILAKQKGEQFKREILRIVLGVLLWVLVPNPTGAAATVIHWILLVSGIVVISLAALFGIIEIIRIATGKETVPPAKDAPVEADFEEKKD